LKSRRFLFLMDLVALKSQFESAGLIRLSVGAQLSFTGSVFARSKTSAILGD